VPLAKAGLSVPLLSVRTLRSALVLSVVKVATLV
jgi:hypothetical protein